MPNRILRESILTSSRVDQLGPEAEVFYRRLMSVVDDYGRSDARPCVLRSSCFPLRVDRVSESSVEEWTREIEEARLAVRYQDGDKLFLVLTQFGEPRAKKSKCSPPPDSHPLASEWPYSAEEKSAPIRSQTRADASICAQTRADDRRPESDIGVFDGEKAKYEKLRADARRCAQTQTNVPYSYSSSYSDSYSNNGFGSVGSVGSVGRKVPRDPLPNEMRDPLPDLSDCSDFVVALTKTGIGTGQAMKFERDHGLSVTLDDVKAEWPKFRDKPVGVWLGRLRQIAQLKKMSDRAVIDEAEAAELARRREQEENARYFAEMRAKEASVARRRAFIAKYGPEDLDAAMDAVCHRFDWWRRYRSEKRPLDFRNCYLNSKPLTYILSDFFAWRDGLKRNEFDLPAEGIPDWDDFPEVVEIANRFRKKKQNAKQTGDQDEHQFEQVADAETVA